MKKIYPLFGIIAPVVYILAVFIGGALRHDYSPFYNSISELSMANAPNLLLMDVLFSIYNVFLLIFGLGAYLDSNVDNSKKYKAATIMLALIGVLGLMVLVFTQDPRGSPATLSGTLHIVLSGIYSAFTIIAILLVGFSFRRYLEIKIFSWYSYITAILVFVSGGSAAASLVGNSAYGGLLERITIFLFMIWLIVFSYIILRKNLGENW